MVESARSVAIQRISAEYKHFPDIEPTPLLVDALDARDGGLARAIDHAVHRRWISLTKVLSSVSNRSMHKLDGPVGATLLVGAAQLLLFDRIPDHAIIHSSVDWIKSRSKHPRSAGFVNAVLRNITRIRGELVTDGSYKNPNHFLRNDGSAWEFETPLFEDDVAAQFGFSQKSWKRLVEVFGPERSHQIGLNSMAEPPIIIANSPSASLSECVIPHSIHGFGVVPAGVDVAALLSSSNARIQDPTSASALSLTSSLNPTRILDVCAGRGTKTKQLRSMFPEAYIGATEPNNKRRESLLEISDRYNFEVFKPDSDGPTEPFDLILLDVPCSNSGVFARRPEAKYRYNDKSVSSLLELQQSILGEAMRVLRPKGYVLYATCSLDPDENINQVDWLIKKWGLNLCEQIESFPSCVPGFDAATWHDGGFAALLQAT